MEQLYTFQIIPWVALAITLISLLFNRSIWPILLVVCLGSAFAFDAIELSGFLILSGLFVLAYIGRITQLTFLRRIIVAVIILACILLAAHLLPGFNNLLLLEGTYKGSKSSAYTMYLNIDKPLLVFVLLTLFPTILKTNTAQYQDCFSNSLKISVLVGLTTMIFTLALLLNLITVEVGIPAWWWIFLLNNLLLTCVAEEVFFRGLLLNRLSEVTQPILALAISSVLFGVAHFGGGIAYVLVATLAGMLYGLVYQLSGKLVYAILSHFVVNAIHFLFFTYPLAV
ncbi:CPBP family intramembrane glutamic endopeptidase [Thalassotalea ganghwensis]